MKVVKTPAQAKAPTSEKPAATFTISAAFKTEVLNASTSLVKTQDEVAKTAVNFYSKFMEAKKKTDIGLPAFFHLFDASIPEKYGKPGSDGRKAWDSNKIAQKLLRLYDLGRKIETQGQGQTLTKDERDARTNDRIALEAKWAKQFGVSSDAMEAWYRIPTPPKWESNAEYLHAASKAFVTKLRQAIAKLSARKPQAA